MPRTDKELDDLHDSVVARFPGGITPKQFALVTLESADEDGRVYPHSIESWFLRQSIIMKMFMDGLIENRGRGYNAPYEWHITDKGRDWLRENVLVTAIISRG